MTPYEVLALTLGLVCGWLLAVAGGCRRTRAREVAGCEFPRLPERRAPLPPPAPPPYSRPRSPYAEEAAADVPIMDLPLTVRRYVNAHRPTPTPTPTPGKVGHQLSPSGV